MNTNTKHFRFPVGTRCSLNYRPNGSGFLLDDTVIVVNVRKDRGERLVRYYVQAEGNPSVQGWLYESDLEAAPRIPFSDRNGAPGEND